MMMYLILAVVIAALACAGLCWALCRAASVPTPAGPPTARVRAKRTRGPLADGFCPVCRAPGVFLTKSGGPNRRYHICDPAAVQTHVWPPAFAVTDDPQPAHTVTTWPPAPPEVQP